MAEPWLSIIGLGEDGLAGLGLASRAALDHAEIIFGGPRHLDLIGAGARGRAWPVPFDVAPVLAARGRRVVVLASGDPFWHGAGGSLAAHLSPGDWQVWLSPALMLYFLLRVTGIPTTEEQALRSRGEDYRRYQRETSMFIPWFPRRAD